MGTTVGSSIYFHTVTNDPATAVITGGSKRRDGKSASWCAYYLVRLKHTDIYP